MTCELLEELKAIGVEVTPHGEDLAIRPASKVPLELKERLRAHKAEVLAVLKARPVTKPDKPIECRYDWIRGYRGLRLRCVVHHHADAGNTVFRTNGGGYDTLAEMLQLGVLTGEALRDARRVN